MAVKILLIFLSKLVFFVYLLPFNLNPTHCSQVSNPIILQVTKKCKLILL